MKRLLAGLGLLAVAVGAPAALTATAGRPAPPSAGSFGGLDSTYLPLEPVLDGLALVAWLVWAYLIVAVLLRAFAVIVAQRTGRTSLVRATDRLAPRPLRRWVDLAVGGALLASTLSVGRAVALPSPVPAVAAVAPAKLAPTTPKHATEMKRYFVRPGDSLWAIAERELGPGFRWREIFRENKGRRFPDGRWLENPRLIHPGWDLRLPENRRPHARNGDSQKSEPPRTTPTPPTAEAIDDAPIPTREIPTPTAGPSTESPVETPPEAQPTEKPPATEATSPHPAPIITLPSGAVVASSFACGVLSAELLTRLRRRRARRLLRESDEVEMPERLVRDMRHAGANPTAAALDVAVDEVIAAWRAHPGAPPRLLAATEERRRVCILLEAGLEHGLPKPAGGRMSPALRFERTGAHVKAEVRGPFPQRLRRIATPLQRGLLVPLGHAAKTAVHLAPLGIGVISVTGGDAGEVVRQLLLAQAIEAGPDDLRITLLGVPDGAFGSLPQVTASPGWDDATGTLQEIQAEFIRRARLFQREGVEDIGEHLAAHADEQLPALVIVAADPPSPMRGVLDAVAQEVRRYGGALVAVGWRPGASALHVTAEADTLRIETALPLPARIAPFTLDEQTAREVEEVIRNASSHDQDNETASEIVPGEGTPASVVQDDSDSHVKLALPPRGLTPKVTPPSDVAAVRCLGAFRITRDGNARVKGWRTKSRELLAFLVAHPSGATKERIMDELWPGADPERLQALFEKAVSVVRTQVRGTDDPRMYVLKVEDSWQLEAGVWWIDAWEFDRLIEQAAGSGEAEAVEWLRQAIGLYAGDFCAELAYPWAEAVRERYRGSFTRACARLGELLSAAGELDEALEVLDRAISADPLCEDLWRRAMTIESRLGRKAAAKERFERLRALLASELDVEPDPETQRVALTMSTRRPPSESLVADGAGMGGSGRLSGG